MRIPFRIACIVLCLLMRNSGLYAQQNISIQASQKIPTSSKRVDSALLAIESIPTKYFSQVDKKIDKYSSRITGKTEKTLAKLAKWETKIKALLDKTSPETSKKLFGENAITFSSLLEKLKKGEKLIADGQAEYDKYRDKLTTNIKYIQSQKGKLDEGYNKTVSETANKLDKLNGEVANTEQINQIIRERKKQLLDEAIKYIGKSKYLSKINKESYYYAQTLRNYKEIFSDKKKAEETAMNILNNIPAFQKFFRENSMLASLFGTASSQTANLSGLQTRSSINGMMQERIAMGGPNARELVSQKMQEAQGQLNSLKDKLSKYGSGSSDADMPDFKPNGQRSKTFAQRLEYGANMLFNKSNSFIPATANLGLSVGYKVNDKSIIGFGAAYKLGFSINDKLRFSHQGVELRSFAEWKLKKQFFISGGYEMTHHDAFKNISALQQPNAWQQSALLGISKKFKLKNKLFKGSSIQLLYDFLWNQHEPAGQPVVFRTGYTF